MCRKFVLMSQILRNNFYGLERNVSSTCLAVLLMFFLNPGQWPAFDIPLGIQVGHLFLLLCKLDGARTHQKTGLAKDQEFDLNFKGILIIIFTVLSVYIVQIKFIAGKKHTSNSSVL